MSDYRKRFRLWIEKDGKVVFGDGRARLLTLINETSSLRKAAEKMGMSYRHAWGIIKEMNEAAGEPLVISERGGTSGGKTTLTPLAIRLLEDYRKTHKEMERGLKYGRTDVAADAIIPVDDGIVLIKRKNEPFSGIYALPGGFLEEGETLEECAVREAMEETGLRCEVVELLGVSSGPDRDPRGRTISAVYVLKPVSKTEILQAGDDAAEAEIVTFPDIKSIELAFDHRKIINRFMERQA